jgi:protoporphyrinogen oxidase
MTGSSGKAMGPLDKQSVAVVGGGIMGVASALELASSGRFAVTLLEKEKAIGGLNSSYQWEDLVCDRFYHVVLPADSHTLGFLDDLGLKSGLVWRRSRTGFYGRRSLVSLSSALDFLRFPFLSMWQKARLGFGLLYSARLKETQRLDKLSAAEWLTRVFGRKVYASVWEPLLRSKLGNACDRTSAGFIWANIARLYGARKTGAKQEKLGYVPGGSRAIWEAAKKKLASLNVKVLTGAPVEAMEVGPAGMRISLGEEPEKRTFDKVLFTVNNPEIRRIVGDVDLNPYWDKLKKVEYLGLICALLVLRKPLSPYYVINLLDPGFPFTGIIESTNVIPPAEFRERHLLYLPKYLTSDDPLNILSDQEIGKLFLEHLIKVFPGLGTQDIWHLKIFREDCVQPVQEVSYQERSVGFKTPLRNVYVANSSMIYDSTINNNAAISLARKAAAAMIREAPGA